jgi:polyferredoxin
VRKLPERNPVTHQKHRQEVLRQITLPLLLGLAILLTPAVLVVIAGFQGGEQVRVWADISTVWLILPMLLVTLIFLALTAGLAFGVTLLLRRLPPYARLVQDFFKKVSYQVRRYSNKAVEPVLKTHEAAAALRSLRPRSLRRK